MNTVNTTLCTLIVSNFQIQKHLIKFADLIRKIMMKKIGFIGLFLVGLLMQGSAQDNAISKAINTNNNV